MLFCNWIFRCDVSTLEKVRELGEKVKNEVGTVTILVNNAGIMPCKPLEAHDETTIKKIFDINVFAHFWVSTRWSDCLNIKHAKI